MKLKSSSLLLGMAGAGLLFALQGLRQKSKVSFQGKTVFITGGSRGLGLVLARKLAKEGAKIALCARNEEELRRAEKELQALGATCRTICCDVRRKEELLLGLKQVQQSLGPIDLLINNAGIISVGPLETMTEEDFREAMDIHFWAPFTLMNAVIPQMKARGEGRIINISSIGGKVPVPQLSSYCASKFALTALSDSYQLELKQYGIYVTTVCPGLMRTGSQVHVRFKGGSKVNHIWFNLLNALPLTSISVEQAASEILEASAKGKAHIVLSLPAKVADKVQHFFPSLTNEMLAYLNYLLPQGTELSKKVIEGKDIQSFASTSILTKGTRVASIQNNEITQKDAPSTAA